MKVYVVSFGPFSPPIDPDVTYILIGGGININEILLESDARKIKNSLNVIKEICGECWSSVTMRHDNFFDPNNFPRISVPNPSGVYIFNVGDSGK